MPQDLTGMNYTYDETGTAGGQFVAPISTFNIYFGADTASQRSRSTSRERNTGDLGHDWASNEIVGFQEMPSSPVLPAISPEGGAFKAGEYFTPPIKTTSAPLPQTADAGLGLYYDDSSPSTPLTSISTASSFADSSASVAHTTLTSSYSRSPSLRYSHGTTSFPSQDGSFEPSSSIPHRNTLDQSLPHSSASRSSQGMSGFGHSSASGSTTSLPSTFEPIRLQNTASQSNIQPMTGGQIYSSRVQNHSTPSLLQQTQRLSQPDARQLEPPYLQRLQQTHPTTAPWQNTFPSSQPSYPPSHWGGLDMTSNPQWTSRAADQSRIPGAFGPGVHHSAFVSQNTFAPPTGLQYGLQGAFLGTSLARDALLAYAHRLYNNPTNPHPAGLTSVPHQSQPEEGSLSHIYYRQLIPLLDSIKSQHPQHLPTLLLLSCAYYSTGDYDACLNVCSEMLQIDPNYVEAMSNIGMVYMAKGAHQDAKNMWLKAIRLRPTYWDAMDNLLHVLCESFRMQDGSMTIPQYRDALTVLEHALNILIGPDGLILVFIPPAHLHRLQNLLFTSGNLRSAIAQDPRSGLHDQTRAIELLLRPPGSIESGNPFSFRDFVVAGTVVGMLGSSTTKASTLGAIADALEVDSSRFNHRMLERGIDWLGIVHRAGQRLVDVLLREGGGALPMVLLTPEKTLRLPDTLFGVYAHVFPALCVRSSYEDYWRPASGASESPAHKITSSILLKLAKLLQSRDLKHISYLFGSDRSIPRSLSLVLMLYYLAVSLNPTPSTYNNMGIIFYTVKHSSNATNAQGQTEVVNGVLLAQLYYKKGLEMDPTHPHLLTNYGSLLKDQGRPLEAISMYKKALVAKPDFDVALANLANVIKDLGRIVESIEFYKRALSVSPDFPDVVCGLVNALSSICDWRGNRGSINDEPIINEHLALEFRASKEDKTPYGWMGKLQTVTKQQLHDMYAHGTGVVRISGSIDNWLRLVENALGVDLGGEHYRRWRTTFNRFYTDFSREEKAINEIGFIIRFVEFMNRIIQKRWYRDNYIQSDIHKSSNSAPALPYKRIRLPGALEPPPVPSVLPFHTFTYPLETRDLRLVAYRNALRISYNVLTSPWLPEVIYKPPPPPSDKLNIGYVSSDFSNHPLAHLMLSVFGMHDRQRFNIYVYATTSSDNSHYRQRIEEDAEFFRDVSKSTTHSIVEQIHRDQIHILVNLGGYTKGARNDIFAARPSPVQVSMIGYAGTSGASWCDYLLGDKNACPEDAFAPYHTALRRKEGKEISRMQDSFTELELETDMPYHDADPESYSGNWSFTEKFLHMPHSYFVTDHRQAFQEDHFDPTSPPEVIWLHEERLRQQMRDQIFPDLPGDAIIFACFSQLYKICPSAFFTWLRILQRVPGSILWLLRFPSAGEEQLKRVAEIWAGDEVASRVRFTDIARKDVHVRRCRVADLFLDTFQCNAHTIAADVLWTGTPILTWPKERLKMCTRVASSIAYATGFGDNMVVANEREYEDRAVALAESISYRLEPNPEGGTDRRGSGELIELRKNIFLNRNRMPLFDTARWTRNLEKGLYEIWDRWATSCVSPWSEDEDEGCVSIKDEDPFFSSS
ncbi:glycosyltransferase family 41 protein [Serendipita vermifera MAFF 305830]|uniref:protein O-GlcNAc transferase n=1 Tax=Serendipita vermifera MAFF 305830 TaxID=933852 RepID=A0A0C2Y078_SERVB|nr:glycosyltransferase family 41 protein [Serendipita vermifera MAFF 305830]